MGPQKHSLVEAFESLLGAPGVSHIWNNQSVVGQLVGLAEI